MLLSAGVKHVNFLSLDIEGHEATALAGLDFDQIHIDVIAAEPRCEAGHGICTKLENAGYTQLWVNVVDTIWVHKSFRAVSEHEVGDGKKYQPYHCQHCTGDRTGECRKWTSQPDDYRNLNK